MNTKKLEKLCLKDFIKDSTTQRLTSIKLPRDLSLGGTKLHKKVYKPNLNVVRNKVNTENKPKTFEKVKFKHKSTEKHNKPKFVQSTSVFSEGIVSDHVNSSHSITKVKNYSNQENVIKIPVPQLQKQNEINIKQEDTVYQEIKQYHDDSDSDSDEKSKFKPTKWKEFLKKVKKSESKSSDFIEFTQSKPHMNLWQLPDTFNFKNSSNNNSRVDCKLSDLPEGNIGKMSVRKSGKINVSIGKISYEFESSEWQDFSESLICINMESKISSALVLGEIEKRFMLTPDWDSLIKN